MTKILAAPSPSPSPSPVRAETPARRETAAQGEAEDREDTELLGRIAEGDRRAFDALYRRVYPKLVKFTARLTRRADLVDEVVNDTMLVVWRRAGEFSGRSRVSTWILGIAHNLGRKALGRAVRADGVELVDDTLACDRVSPEHVAHGRSVGARIDWALSRLSTDHRLVIELTFVHHYRYREIAEVLDCPLATVKTRVFNARAQLRRLLADAEG